MYDRILVPVSGSPFAEGVIPHVCGIAAATGAKITLLRVIQGGDSRDDAQAETDRLAATYGADSCVVDMQGDIPTTILGEARSEPHTLIAIATPGRTNVAVAVLGSTARKIVFTSHSPVLVYRSTGAPARPDALKINEVLLPLDGSTLSESMRMEAISWARALGAFLTLVQVLPENVSSNASAGSSDMLDSNYVSVHAQNISREFDMEVNYEVFHGDPASRLLEYIGDRQDILGVIATRGRNPVQSALFGSVTTKLAHNSSIPLVVQAPNKIR